MTTIRFYSQQFNHPSPIVRSTSQGGGSSMGSSHTRSMRGQKRNDPNKVGPSVQQGHGSSFGQSRPSIGPGDVPLKSVAPLELSANRWMPNSISRKPQSLDADSPEPVDRKVKGLLNKLTMEKFDSISDQIIAWANKSEKEKDGRTIIQVIRLVFEKAIDEVAWSEMYARLYRKMMEQISSKIQDDGIKNSEGKPIAGGQLSGNISSTVARRTSSVVRWRRRRLQLRLPQKPWMIKLQKPRKQGGRRRRRGSSILLRCTEGQATRPRSHQVYWRTLQVADVDGADHA